MKKCPICGTENNDDAVSCSNCGYVFPNLNSSNIPPEPPAGNPSNGRNKKQLLIGVVGIIVIVLVIAGFVFLPPLLHHKSNTVVAIAEKYYGNGWQIVNNDSGSMIIYSNNTAKISLLNGTSEIINYNSSGFAGTELNALILNQKNTNNELYLINITFPNATLSNQYFNTSILNLKEQIATLNISLNNMAYQGFSIYYIVGGNETIDGTPYPIPGIAIAHYKNNFIEIETIGVLLSQEFIKSVITYLK
ncbi:zinc-ribbon domain-containing protein [Acidianus sulfidivorans JP7]|uniref:Putative zinc-ribbon domain-containing protein n=1 Tax=Acidianus sulfidivorans JP7 TaxID=619593 RepID=A0A2U9ILN3_9CREN|nr:zinc ribbon domain-containing protein [Acidianus sulfidivorans]AWR96969.1 zinc-ribbon domain-containing protein [Acidianus sulfidivorans JP7]